MFRLFGRYTRFVDYFLMLGFLTDIVSLHNKPP
jgi:hypothetical protein